jgi:hypothetical protein
MSIAHTVETNISLLHLDLSQNNFTVMQLEVIAEGLKENHTIMGLHMEGNNCEVDSKGFVRPNARPMTVQNQHISPRTINLPTFMGKKPRSFANCWYCEKWVEVTFRWNPTAAAKEDPIYLHLE